MRGLMDYVLRGRTYLAFWAMWIGLSGEVRAQTQENPLLMSPYEVSARTVEFRGWTKLRSPNFIVYTDAGMREVRPLVRQMEMLHLVTQLTFGRRPLNKSPAIVILPTLGSDWRKLRSKGGVEWRVAVSSLDWFQPGSVVEYDWQDRGISVLWASLLRSELTWLNLQMPLAMENGFAYYFETIRMSKEGLRVGSGNRRVTWLQRRSDWLEWDQLFKINQRSPEYTRDSNLLHRFNAQAAIFVHFMMTRDEPGRLDQLLRWAALLRAGREPTEARFYETFGMTWEECTDRLSKFLRGEKFNIKLYSFPPEALDFVVTEVGVKTQEMRDLFVLIQIINQRVADSETSLDAVLSNGLQTTSLRSLLVLACREWSRNEAAMSQLELMIEEDQATPEVFDLGAHIMRENYMNERSLDSRITEDQFAQLRQWSQLALSHEPLLSCMNETLCWAEALAPDADGESVERIKKILTDMEGNGDTDQALAAFAMAAWRAGQFDRAQQACETLVGSDYSSESSRQFAVQMLTFMGLAVPPFPPEPVLPEPNESE